MEKLISEMIGFFLVMVIMILIFLTGALFYHVNQYNEFKNQCIEVVQRTGEMNGNTQHYLNRIAKTYYAGYSNPKEYTGKTKNSKFRYRSAHPDFTVQAINGKDQGGYGKPIEFYINQNVATTPQQQMSSMFGFKGGQVIGMKKLIVVRSQVRGGSQDNDSTKYAG